MSLETWDLKLILLIFALLFPKSKTVMKRILFSTFILVAISLAATRSATAQHKKSGATSPTKSSTPAEKILVQEVDDAGLMKAIKESAQRSRPLLVNFWATWCIPCRDEFPDLVKINDDYNSRGIDLITVSLDDVAEIGAGVPKFLQQMQAGRIRNLLLNSNDPEATINAIDNTWRGQLPATILFDTKGQIVFRHTGRINAEEVRNAINKVTSDKQ